MVRSRLTTVTSKGQVTIPAEVRRYLGIEPHNKVSFVIEDGSVRLQRHGSVIERTAGILHRPGQPGLSAAEIQRAAEEEIADDSSRRGQ